MDLGNVFLYRITATKPTILIDYQLGINTEHYSRRTNAMTHPSIGAPHTPCASPMRCWIMNFQRDSYP